MPCSDISEIIDIQLDPSDRLVTYRLNKRTCGAEIGQASLILSWVAGKTPETILSLAPEQLHQAFNTTPSRELFLLDKHLLALQHALGSLTGAAPAPLSPPLTQPQPQPPCTPVKVSCDPTGTTFVGLINVDAVTRAIKACGNCGRCGSRPTPG